MASKDFNPIDHAREPREEGWKQETEQIAELLHQRDDLRIGQLLINAVSKDTKMPERPEKPSDLEDMTDDEALEYIEEVNNYDDKCKAAIERKLWSIEADELLKLLENFIGEHQE